MKQLLLIQTQGQNNLLVNRNVEEVVAALKNLSDASSREIIFSAPEEDADKVLEKIFQANPNLVL